MLRLTLFIWMIMAGGAFAQNLNFLSSQGILFDYDQNRHGVVLTVIEETDDLLVDPDASVPVADSGEAVYLGRGCDAYSRKLGDGRWRATDGGFLIRFGDVEIAFPGQEIDVGRGVTCAE